MEDNSKIKASFIDKIQKRSEEYKKGFYFVSGKDNFEELKKNAKNNEYNLDDALKCLKEKAKENETNKNGDGDKEKKKTPYENFQDNFGKLSDEINKFVVYCDVNAKSKYKDGKNYYEGKEKKAIAKAFIRQNAWAINIIQYLINLKNKESDLYKNVAFGVKRAIEYFNSPATQFNILSEDHIKNIEKHYLNDFKKDNQNAITFDEKLLDYFKGILNPIVNGDSLTITDGEKTGCVHKENFTDICVQYLYDVRAEWSFEVETKQLENNHNLILNGAPGTGKTYLANKIAKKLTKNKEEQIDFVQFHPSYDYTDFVEGLRPNNNNGFELKPGVFKVFCDQALDEWNKTWKECYEEKEEERLKKCIEKAPKFVFIIDEINRGEISKIFGELFFSIDPGYRGKKGKVHTQYANMERDRNAFDQVIDNGKKGQFFVPHNVYIIGTMNDIDRSVESLDFAFRRRFSFKEITAKESAERILIDKITDPSKTDKAIAKMGNINKKLSDLGLPECYHIGASYFAKIENYKGPGMWKDLWNYHLKGVLYEYFRGEPDADNNMKELEKAYNLE